MSIFFTDEFYQNDIDQYNDTILKLGASSPLAERAIIALADKGNTIALKAYGDLLFNRKAVRRHPFRDAFHLYLQAGGISIDEDGSFSCTGRACPSAFWMVGYFLVNYHLESFLLNCETIHEIEALPRKIRLSTALELANACLSRIDAPGANNLIGRIYTEIDGNEEYGDLKDKVLSEINQNGSAVTLSQSADSHFKLAAEEGYVYACNNLAAGEAAAILELSEDDPKLSEHIEQYIHYLTISADRFEPYAANRLGLFYLFGEIKAHGGDMPVNFRNYCNTSLAKEYFLKATVYPDVNSAWAYFNLIKYFPKDYNNNIDLLNEHMESIKKLNPEVYDIAIEL